MKWSVLAVMFLVSSGILRAQPCSFEGLDALTLKVHKAGSNQLIQGLKIYLVDTNNLPITYQRKQFVKSERKYVTVTEDMNFWINLRKTKKYNRTFNRENYRYEAAGNNYITVINDKLPARDPVNSKLRVMIVDTDGENNGGYFDTSIYEVDYRRAVNICETHFRTKKADAKLGRPILNLEGNVYSPVDIVLVPFKDLNKGLKASSDPKFEFYIETDSIRDAKNTVTQIRVKKITVYKTKQVDSLQVIYNIPDYFPVHNRSNLVEFEDYNFDGYTDIRTLTDAYVDSVGHYREFYHYYIYNKNRQQFVTDTLLSKYHNVYFNHTNKTVTHALIKESGLCTENHVFMLNNNSWEKHELVISCKPNATSEERTIYYYVYKNGKWEGGPIGKIQ